MVSSQLWAHRTSGRPTGQTADIAEGVAVRRADGRTLFVTAGDSEAGRLHEAMEQVPWDGRALDVDDVDVKDLLETGKVVMERAVLREMLERHQSDLVSRVFVQGVPQLQQQQ